MKVLLFALNASYQHTNLALRCLASPLRAEGHTVTLLEAHTKERRDAVLHALYTEHADVYGFSVYLWNRAEMLSFAADLKALCPDCRTVFGGPEVSFADNSFFDRYPFVDYILRGEGEESFPRLLRSLPPIHTCHDGMPYAGFVHAGTHYEADAALPKGGIVYYESARGCPFRCAYCLSAAKEYSGVGLRMKSAEQTLSELKALSARPEVRFVKLIDRTFNADLPRAKAIWRGMAEGDFPKCYQFEICASLLDEEAFAILSRFPKGRIQLEIGVQSTLPQALRAVDRTEDPERILEALRRLREMKDLHVHADLIAGLPYEGFARFGASFDALYGLCDQLQAGFLKLLPGAPLTRRAAEYGYRWQAEPPYEILCNDFLSYDELIRLKGVAAVTDRFSNSGRFQRGLSLLLSHEKSPFACLDAFAVFLCRHPTALSQNAAYTALFDFGAKRLPAAAVEPFRDALAADYLCSEATPLPPILHSDKQNLFPYRDRLSAWSKRWEPKLSSACTVFRRFAFDPEAVTVIDRRNHQSYRIPLVLLADPSELPNSIATFMQ